MIIRWPINQFVYQWRWGNIGRHIFQFCIIGGIYAVPSERPVHHGGSGLYCISYIVGGVYAVQSERSVHHGGSGVELPLHDGRTGLRDSGSDQQTDDPSTEPDPPPVHLVRLHPPLILHVQGLHENEVTVSISHYRPQTKLREGNVFTPVCRSFCSQGMGCIPACNGPVTGNPPPVDTPFGQTAPTLGRHPHPGQTLPIWVIYCVYILAQKRSNAGGMQPTGMLFLFTILRLRYHVPFFAPFFVRESFDLFFWRIFTLVAKVLFLLVSMILSTGGVCLSACWDTTTTTPPPPEADPPGADPPLGADTVAYGIRSMSGRYASYWNAFV